MATKKIIFLITALLYILYTIFPLFADVFHIPVWLPSMAAFTVMIILFPGAFTNRVVYWFIVYAAVLALYTLLGRPLTIGIGSVASGKKIFIEFAHLLPSISMFSVLYYLRDDTLNRKLFVYTCAILYVSFIIAVPLMQRYGSIRQALFEERSENVAEVPGLPGYSLMHAYTLFLPVLCYGAKVVKDRIKFLVIVGIFVLCFVIYDTFVTTSLLLMICVLLYSVLYSETNNVYIWLLLFFLVILYESGFFISLIDWVLPAFESTPVERKLFDFKTSMQQGQLVGDTITGRMGRHNISWDSFISNPFFGTGMAGGHSSLLDRLGGMGLAAGLPFIMIIVSFIKITLKVFKTRTAKSFLWIGIVISFVYLYNKGNWSCESWLVLMVVIPAGIRYFEQTSNSL